jgi:hypothetical protein
MRPELTWYRAHKTRVKPGMMVAESLETAQTAMPSTDTHGAEKQRDNSDGRTNITFLKQHISPILPPKLTEYFPNTTKQRPARI